MGMALRVVTRDLQYRDARKEALIEEIKQDERASLPGTDNLMALVKALGAVDLIEKRGHQCRNDGPAQAGPGQNLNRFQCPNPIPNTGGR